MAIIKITWKKSSLAKYPGLNIPKQVVFLKCQLIEGHSKHFLAILSLFKFTINSVKWQKMQALMTFLSHKDKKGKPMYRVVE